MKSYQINSKIVTSLKKGTKGAYLSLTSSLPFWANVIYGLLLKTFNLECTPLSTHWGTSQLIKLKNLTKLNLFNLRLFDSEHLKALAFNCEHLESLNLEEVSHSLIFLHTA